MIILPEPNNDLWIYESEEHEPFDYKTIKNREKAIELIPQHTYKEFCHILVGDDPKIKWVMPRKWTPEMNGYWDCNFSYLEIFDSLCVKKKKIDTICVYEMSWKEIFVFYEGVDSGGYDVEGRSMVFENKEKYNLKFQLI